MPLQEVKRAMLYDATTQYGRLHKLLIANAGIFIKCIPTIKVFGEATLPPLAAVTPSILSFNCLPTKKFRGRKNAMQINTFK